LSKKLNIPLFHMDAIRWDQRGYEIRRSVADISKDLDAIKKQDQWILEGVFGKMEDVCLPFSTLLIWLDLPWKDCKQNLLFLGPQLDDHLNPSEKERALTKLIEWASEHEFREDANSWGFFNTLYRNFKNKKVCLRSREDIMSFLHDDYRDGKVS